MIIVERQKADDVKDMMNKSREWEGMDSQILDYVGEEAVEQYYHHYKKLDRVKQENRLTNINESPFTAVLDSTERKRLMPSKLGLVRLKGDQNTLDIKNQKYGDEYIECLSKGVTLMPNISRFNLSANRIGEIGADGLIRMLNSNIQVLDISDNNIEKMGVASLSKFIAQRDCKVTHLNLSSNKLGDKNIQHLLQAIQKNYTL